MIAFLLLAAAPVTNCDHPRSQRDMTRCSVAEREAADGALDRQYGKAIAAMRLSDTSVDRIRDRRPGYEETLRAAQRAWLSFRDAECRVEGYRMRGGSAESMAVQLCLTTLTRTRTQQLKTLIAEP
jgi:uncharacterized protein YecT (DUF1311 family)